MLTGGFREYFRSLAPVSSYGDSRTPRVHEDSTRPRRGNRTRAPSAAGIVAVDAPGKRSSHGQLWWPPRALTTSATLRRAAGLAHALHAYVPAVNEGYARLHNRRSYAPRLAM